MQIVGGAGAEPDDSRQNQTSYWSEAIDFETLPLLPILGRRDELKVHRVPSPVWLPIGISCVVEPTF